MALPNISTPTFIFSLGVNVPNNSLNHNNFGLWFKNYNNKWGGQNYGLLNSAIGAGADLAGNLINSSGLSSGAGNIMSGIGNIVGNIPGPIGWAGKGLALAGLAVNALWGHKFNDANVAAAESANRERNNWQFGDYSNTDALLAGSMANVQLGNVNKSFLGKEGPFSNAVTNKMKLINNDRMLANLRANNSELNAYNNYLTGMVRNAIAGDSMGNVNAAAAGGPLNMISGPMTPFGNRYFANGGLTHGGLFSNGFIEINNGGSHEMNPNQGVQYGVDQLGTPNMVEEGETIFDDYVFSKRIKFPKKYKDEFALGGKLWKKSFADVSKMIAKESDERPNDPISQRSLKAMGGKLADIQEEVKAKLALDKMDPREVMAMLQQLAMMQGGGQQPMQQGMEDPYQLQAMMLEEEPMVAACGGKLHAYGGRINKFNNGGLVNLFLPGGYTNMPWEYQYGPINPQQYMLDLINAMNMLEVRKRVGRGETKKTTAKKEEAAAAPTVYDVSKYGFKRGIKGLSALESIYNNTKFDDPKSIANLLYHYVDLGIMDYRDAARLFYNYLHNIFPGMKEGENSAEYMKNLLGLLGGGYDTPTYKYKDGQVVRGEDGSPVILKNTHSDWVGPQYFNAVGNTPNTFALSRGFSGNKDLKGLNYDFNDNSTVDDFMDYLSAYGSTDPQVLGKYLNEKRAELEKQLREYYNENKDFDKELEDIKYYNDLNSNSDKLSNRIINNARATYSNRVEDARAARTADLTQEIMDEIDDFMDANVYNNYLFDDPDYQAYVNQYEDELAENGIVDVDKIKAVDPNSKDFNKLTPFELKIARGKWISENFENNKEWKTYKEKFLKEEADELARQLREQEMLDMLRAGNLPTWMRYAPLAFSSIATLTDALGLTNKPDLTPYNQLISLSDRLNRTPPVRYRPTFLPLQYQPINLNSDLALSLNLFSATSRNVNNIAGGNMGAALAGNLTALNQMGINLGKIRSAIAEADLKNRAGIAEYNNKGAYQDAMGSLQAQQINTNNILNAQKFGYQALADALKYYQAEQQAANAAKQVNLTHAVNSWANVGRENMYMNMINNNKAYDYFITQSGDSPYKYGRKK